MSMLQRPAAPSSGPEKRPGNLLRPLLNAAHGLLLAVFLMEGLWLYLWMQWLASSRSLEGSNAPLSVPSILVVLWASYHGVQVLGEQLWSDRKARLLTGVFLVAVLAVVARLENGAGYGLLDPGWFGYAGDQLANHFLTPIQVTLLGGFYLWWRGYRLAHSRLHAEQIIHSFVVGLVAIIAGLLIQEMGSPYTGRGVAALVTAGFFFAALLALALSHVREIRAAQALRREETRAFNQEWPAVTVGVVVMMVLVGWLASLLFSFNVLSPVFHLLSLVGDILVLVLYYVIVIPTSYFVAGMMFVLLWLVSLVGPATDVNIEVPAAPDVGEREPGGPGEGGTPWFLVLLRWSLVSLVAALAVFFLVRLLLRFRERRASEGVIDLHESVGSWQDVVRDVMMALLWTLLWFKDKGRRLTRAVRIPLPGSPQGPDEEADVRALYLRLLVEARDAGFPKRAGETPLEYLATLERNLPAERVALERLTKDYVVVRYGEQEISEEETGLLNRLWRNIYERIHYGDESQRTLER